jgi:hypothetical protein
MKVIDNQTPLHQLKLKVDDNCIILATIDKEQGLTTNTRARIVQITNPIERVVTLSDTHPVFENIH